MAKILKARASSSKDSETDTSPSLWRLSSNGNLIESTAKRYSQLISSGARGNGTRKAKDWSDARYGLYRTTLNVMCVSDFNCAWRGNQFLLWSWLQYVEGSFESWLLSDTASEWMYQRASRCNYIHNAGPQRQSIGRSKLPRMNWPG